ncbi:hypothetical protein [Streptomyces sp. A5-4]|uniref:hypothetical protein n=1 Tax=Streptomyces sp. A5-4 TaxID=3384771 RepID=UPI003DA883D0
MSAAGRRVVSARSIDVMHTPPEGREYAMGWSKSRPGEQPQQIRHTGELLTHNSIETLLPDSKIGIAVVTNTGMVSGDDAAVMLDGLIDLAEGRSPTVETPFVLRADYVLAALTLLAIALGTLGVVRAPRWARRTADRPLWRAAVRMLPYVLPIVLLIELVDLIGLLMRREGTLAQVALIWPALLIWVATTALACAVVTAARAVATFHTRRHSRGAGHPARVRTKAGDGQDRARTSTGVDADSPRLALPAERYHG